jgi:hypothetical protein
VVPDLSDSTSMPRLPAPRSVWRVALLWQGTVLDVVTLKRARGTIHLRTGEVLRARAVEGAIEIEGAGAFIRAEAGVLTDLPAGHALIATHALPEPRVSGLSAVDSTLFHAAMIGAAVQACVVSALVLAPAPTLDFEAGAGMKSEWRRMLLTPGGTAPTKGPASVNAVGRDPEEGEREEPVRSKGQRPTHRTGKGLTAEQALDEMKRFLHLGNDGVELRDILGEVAQATAKAPVVGAGMGGLAPRDPQNAGAGNGLVGAGESRIAELLKERIRQADKASPKLPRREARAIPVNVVEVPTARVSLAADEALDPVVKDHLMRAVRQRHNAVRYCYESWGLAADVRRSGRLVLELTLRPDGRVADPKVTAESPGLKLVGECVERMAAEWYLGDGLVEEPKRLSFPFVLQPHQDVKVYDFDDGKRPR